MPSLSDEMSEVVRRVAAWCGQQPVRLCILFGSQATGKARPDSDIDLAIWPSQSLTTAQKLRWVSALSELADAEVNLVLVSADLDPVLGFELVRDGSLVFEREPALWPHLRAQLWHGYEDSLPFRRAARAQLRQFAQEVERGH
jgi:predicted nucleotidyltransferase